MHAGGSAKVVPRQEAGTYSARLMVDHNEAGARQTAERCEGAGSGAEAFTRVAKRHPCVQCVGACASVCVLCVSQ